MLILSLVLCSKWQKKITDRLWITKQDVSPGKALVCSSGRALFVGSKFHGEEESKDGPVDMMQALRSANSDFVFAFSAAYSWCVEDWDVQVP